MTNYKIVSIVAYDRSGTTILGNLLHGFKNTFNLGEIDRGIPKLKKERHKICNCGLPIVECAIWKKTDESFFKNNPDFKRKVYDWVSEESGNEILIDSSKGFNQIKIASALKQDNQIIIHLIRNPKGVIYSRMKTRKRRVANGSHPKPYIARHVNLLMIFDAFEWCYENFWIERFKRRKKNVISIFYENLESDYSEKIVPFLIEAGMNEERVETKTPHVLAGNLNRYKPVTKIKIDNQWAKGLNSVQKGIVDLITFPLRVFYKYSFENRN